ncbi:hypothetical protein SAMN06309944_0703 [Micrococcales bacterium KH10]|nr:hypothetical protein SAMN06309944_0703 [Micrococcales bacterium KH10]
MMTHLDLAKSEWVTVPIDTGWTTSMQWLNGVAGGAITVALIVSVIALATTGALLILKRTVRFDSGATSSTLVFILVGAIALGSLSGMVKWGGALVTPRQSAIKVKDTSDPGFLPALPQKLIDEHHARIVRPYDGSGAATDTTSKKLLGAEVGSPQPPATSSDSAADKKTSRAAGTKKRAAKSKKATKKKTSVQKKSAAKKKTASTATAKSASN